MSRSPWFADISASFRDNICSSFFVARQVYTERACVPACVCELIIAYNIVIFVPVSSCLRLGQSFLCCFSCVLLFGWWKQLGRAQYTEARARARVKLRVLRDLIQFNVGRRSAFNCGDHPPLDERHCDILAIQKC